MNRTLIVLVLVALAGCATSRVSDPWRDRIRACGTFIGTCGEIVF